MSDAPHGQAYWARMASRYDLSMLLLGGPMPRMVELVAEAVRGRRRVLEVAAGTGLVTPAIAREAEEVIATDYAAPMVATVQRKLAAAGATNVRCQQADLVTLPFDDGSFDAVVACNVLHLVPRLPEALASLRRVLRAGGTLVAPTYCHGEHLLARTTSRAVGLTGFPGHRRFTAATLRAAVTEAGLQVGRTVTLPGVIPIGYVEGTFPPVAPPTAAGR